MAGLLHAWREWLAGHSTQGLTVFGIYVLWWGRIGKLLEFAGSLTVIIDILGPERIRSWGDRLATRGSEAASRVRYAWSHKAKITFAYGDILAAKQREIKRPSPGRQEEVRKADEAARAALPMSNLRFLISGLVGIGIWIASIKYVPVGVYDGLGRGGVATVLAWIVGILLFVSPFAMIGFGAVLVELVIAGFSLAVSHGVAHPIARALRKFRRGTAVKWAGVWVITFGFVLDLLAS